MPVEDVSGGPCGWCRHTHPVDAPHTTDPQTRPTEEETTMSYGHFSVDCGDYHGLVRDFNGPRPTIVALCGSTRFREELAAANRNFTKAGAIVVAPGVFGHSGDPLTDDEKLKLDDLHKRKIDLADEVFVVNPGGYIGESTRSEVEYAAKSGKPISYLEPPCSVSPS